MMRLTTRGRRWASRGYAVVGYYRTAPTWSRLAMNGWADKEPPRGS